MQRNTITNQDALSFLQTLPDGVVSCIVTSPPYFGLRDYGTGRWDGGDPNCDHVVGRAVYGGITEKQASSAGTLKRQAADICPHCGAKRIDDQIGLEPSLREYVDRLVVIFREARRVLRDDGVLWLNLGDSYNAYKANTGASEYVGERDQPTIPSGYGLQDKTLANKNLFGVPWRVAFGLQDDGWILRSDVIWAKRNCMPESITDRPTRSHEYVFLFAKKPRYWYDAEAIREPNAGIMPYGDKKNFKMNSDAAQGRHGSTSMFAGGTKDEYIEKYYINGRNARSVWILSTEPTPFAHFATMPKKLVERCIKAGCPSQICTKCGAPWQALVEREAVDRTLNNGQNGFGVDEIKAIPNKGSSSAGYVRTNVLGYGPTCDCAADTQPGLVLDPFMGSGTVALVARGLGRDYIGCDLNPEYVALAQRRLDAPWQPSLLNLLDGTMEDTDESE